MSWMDGWWAYAFIAIAGWLATDIWRWLGVLAGNRLRDDSEALNWVRAVATALVAAVIAKLVLYPTGGFGPSPRWLRLGSRVLGALAFWPSRLCGFGSAPSFSARSRFSSPARNPSPGSERRSLPWPQASGGWASDELKRNNRKIP